MKKDYFITFTCGYAWLSFAECLEDAIVLAKANAIHKGYSKPLLESIKFSNGDKILYGHPLIHYLDKIPYGISGA